MVTPVESLLMYQPLDVVLLTILLFHVNFKNFAFLLKWSVDIYQNQNVDARF